MGEYLDRYLAGDHHRVWHELRRLGASVRHDDTRGDAVAVARVAMTRARDNVLTLIARLREQGYRFGDPWNPEGAQEPYAPPDEQTPAFVAWCESRFGLLPMTVRAWIEIVGDVNLLGVHPDWPPTTLADPLVVEFEYKTWRAALADREHARRFFESEHEAWLEWEAEGNPRPFALDVAPDHLHKANFSGGAPYGVLVPDASVDATFRFADGVLIPFIEYLRLTFHCGGFTGFWQREGGKGLDSLWEGLLEI